MDFFEMPLPIRAFKDGQDTLLILNHTFSGQKFEIALPFEPDSIKFDPDKWIVSRDNFVEEIISGTAEAAMINGIVISPNPVGDAFEIRIEDASLVKRVQFITISDNQGRIVLNTDRVEPNMVISTEGWPSGQYSIAFKTSRDLFFKQLIKI